MCSVIQCVPLATESDINCNNCNNSNTNGDIAVKFLRLFLREYGNTNNNEFIC
ncbi:hypothetical protein L9F63_026522, partial [Diploptera punctata]